MLALGVIRAVIVNLADVGMIQRGDDCTSCEAFAELRGGDFYRDIPIQTRVPRGTFSHAIFADGSEDLVGAENPP